MVTSHSFEQIIENAVTSSIEQVFENGKLPEALTKAIEAAVEKAVTKAMEEAEFWRASSEAASSGPASSGPASSGTASSGTSSSGPASSGPGEDNEKSAELDETVVFINPHGRGVYHRPSCCHVKRTSRRFRACKICFER